MDWTDFFSSATDAAGKIYSTKLGADAESKKTKAAIAGQKTALALLIGGALLIVVVLVIFFRRK